jgi:hypothetical protein
MNTPSDGTNSQTCAAPPPDAAFVRITRTIEQDHAERGVFQRIKTMQMVGQGSGWTEYLIPLAEARLMLQDAEEQRRGAVCGGSAKAYRSLISHLSEDIKRAERRPVILAAEVATCISRESYYEAWRGTKAQLHAAGIGIDMACFPGETGGNRHWAQTSDSRGYKARFRGVADFWGLYTVEIHIPRDVAEARCAEENGAAERRKAEARELELLKSMPATRQEYRHDAAERFWVFVNVFSGLVNPRFGFRLSEESQEEFLNCLRDAYWIIKRDGEVEGESPRQELQRRLSAGAKSNVALQSFITTLKEGLQ